MQGLTLPFVRHAQAAYALAPPLPRRVGDELRDQLLFGQTRRAAQLLQPLLRFSQRNPKLLQGFRGIHSGRYRIIWRLLTLEEGEIAAEVVYVGNHAEGDQRDAYAELQRLFNTLDL